MTEADRSRLLSCLLALVLALAACLARGPIPDPLTGEIRTLEPDDATGHTQLEEFFANGARCNEILLRSPYVEDFLLAILSTVAIDLEPPYDENAILEVTLGTVGQLNGGG